MWSFPCYCDEVFFRFDFSLKIHTPEFENFRKYLVDGEHPEFIQPLFDGCRNTVICMVGHDIGHILENFQILNLKGRTILRFTLIGRFKTLEVFEDITLEFHTIESGDSGGGAKFDLLITDSDCFF